ncbi:MAG: glutamate-5-semialdehyde dehydrogenase [Candidatus Sumerlaeaceae bacterium]|nr:glutamate-5-semialdehyde dehydrogenase [Candidatus Sumerlaeaceae bacterium]
MTIVETPKTAAVDMRTMAKNAREAAARLAVLRPAAKNAALVAMADAFLAHRARIKAENEKDLAAGREKGLSAAMLDRLTLNDKRIDAMAAGLREVALLDDPVGEIYEMKTRPNGLRIGRMRMPFGVIGIIYESRPNVTADAGALCVKSGNAVILRGGSEAIHSNRILATIMDDAGAAAGLPANCIQLVPTTDRAAVQDMLRLNGLIDLIIPRGGKSLIEMVMENSTIPVIKHYDGNCHVYVDATADLDMAASIVLNSKAQRTGVCNAAESLLVHEAVAAEFLPRIGTDLTAANVEIRGDEKVRKYIPAAKPATEDDHRAEFLDLIISAAVVPSLDAAVDWINEYGSHHTEAIVTRDHDSAMKFTTAVDSACVHINASTRFSDGGEYGMGCEIGISTDKLHARGPMGLKELTTYKFIVFGEGQIRV